MEGQTRLNYKFRDLKVFNSVEWLANNEKKYRQVFDEAECSYIYAELSFYNKLFDEEDWSVQILLRCLSADGREMCTLTADRDISKNDNIVFIREGFGVKEAGTFWKRGTYRWEAHINNKFVAEKSFYIEKEGIVTPAYNPYFSLQQIKFYEGPDNDVVKADRQYLKAFNAEQTRYVWVEINASNLIKGYDEYWVCELSVNFINDARQLKGSVSKLIFVYPQDENINCTIGFGSDVIGTWGRDDYWVEIVFMDQLIAFKPFKVGDAAIPAIEEDFVPGMGLVPHIPPEIAELRELTLADLLREMDSMIGLEPIKKKIREYTSYLNFINIRREKGIDDNDKLSLHAVFTGNPGTGKTTVARMLGQIYHKMGMLSKGHVHEVDRTDLVAEYIGQTAPKTKEAIKKARGGILFIDEAYALARKDDDAKDFGKEVIEILLKELSDGPGDIAVIVAGYPKEMEVFLQSNPGLESRFAMFYDFPDYLPQELILIADQKAAKKKVEFSPAAREFLYKKLVDAYRRRSESFGNARYVNSLLDESKMNMGLRVMQLPEPENLTEKDISTIELPDVERIFLTKYKEMADIPVDEELLRESLGSLRSMVGLEVVKNEIDELVKLVRYYREIGKDVRQTFSLHAIFTGNPGTGKTTVARILAQIYKALGILERGNLVECDRQNLVGSYVGQTAIKTAALIEQAMGGVLFIDEAYSLTQISGVDFGKEAVETILKIMEDKRGEFVVIAAGYTDNMEKFLESNPGLKSRFDRAFQFYDYTAEELMEIAVFMFNNKKIIPDREAAEHLQEYFAMLYKTKDKFFGNARTVRKVVEEAVKNQHLRLAQLPQEKRTPEMIGVLTMEDVKDFKVEPGETTQKGIGYRFGS
jgi:SpoVK/Ycf46/Vps4 family AAA+-type ATPase